MKTNNFVSMSSMFYTYYELIYFIISIKLLFYNIFTKSLMVD